MKSTHAIGLAAGAVLVTIVIEESRISAIRGNARPPESASVSSTPAPVSPPSPGDPAPPVKTRSSPGARQEPPAKEASAGKDDSFASSARKMWDNPAGKSMMSQGAKMAVAMMYQDFIDGLKLSKEEEGYFKDLLGREVAAQQELGMKMLGATPEERTALADDLKKRGEETQEEIRKFLNSEDDLKAYNSYKDRLPEHQQLDGIRTSMSSQGVPLDAATETKLVDAMYRTRTEAKAPDLSGPGAIEEFSKGNVTETYQKSWDVQQEALRKETADILSPEQATAFQEYQKQAREMQMMGIKMAEQMMSGKKGAKQ